MVEEKDTDIWSGFAQDEKLTQEQLDQFKKYEELLREWNELFNLTAITTTPKIITHHFQDSLRIADFIPMQTISMIADVGSGAGFPGIPLKIKFPHLKVLLIEVTHKKIEFLHHVIKGLGLENIEVTPHDWRTFLRTTHYAIDLFVARASLQPGELMRLFKPGCVYNNSTLIYWSSQEWQPTDQEKLFIQEEKEYLIDDKKRRYIIFKKPKNN